MNYQFASFRFDAERGLEGPDGLIALRRSDAMLLRLLLEADGRTVTKDAIVANVWGGRAITDDSIFQATRRLRLAMPNCGGTEIIQTVHGTGLRIGVRVRILPAHAAVSGTAPSAQAEATHSLTSARELSARRTPGSIAAALQAVMRALELDPDFVAAWCALAEFQVMRAARGLGPPLECGAAAVDAAEHALTLDPLCAHALAVRGWVRAAIQRNVQDGLADVDRSVATTGNHWLSRGLRGWVLVTAGRVAEAAEEVRMAMELNPWAAWFSGLRAQYLWYAGHAQVALDEARNSVQRFPDVEVGYQQMCAVASGLGLHDEAIAAGRRAAELAVDLPLVHATLAAALALAGKRAEARRLIHSIETSFPTQPDVWLACASEALGERPRALELLRMARDQGSPQFAYAFVDPRLAGLRGDPAFEQLRPNAG